jgi:hypothetical protein
MLGHIVGSNSKSLLMSHVYSFSKKLSFIDTLASLYCQRRRRRRTPVLMTSVNERE